MSAATSKSASGVRSMTKLAASDKDKGASRAEGDAPAPTHAHGADDVSATRSAAKEVSSMTKFAASDRDKGIVPTLVLEQLTLESAQTSAVMPAKGARVMARLDPSNKSKSVVEDHDSREKDRDHDKGARVMARLDPSNKSKSVVEDHARDEAGSYAAKKMSRLMTKLTASDKASGTQSFENLLDPSRTS